MPLIFLEGVNGIGKTTVSRLFEHYIHFPTGDGKCSQSVLNHRLYNNCWGKVFRRDPEEKNAQYKARLDILVNREVLEDLSKNSICISDRSIISNFIYSPIDKSIVYHYLNLFKTDIILVVLYTNNISILEERVIKRTKKCAITELTKYKIIKELDAVNDIFKSFTLNLNKLPPSFKFIKISIDNMTPEEIAQSIRKELEC